MRIVAEFYKSSKINKSMFYLVYIIINISMISLVLYMNLVFWKPIHIHTKQTQVFYKSKADLVAIIKRRFIRGQYKSSPSSVSNWMTMRLNQENYQCYCSLEPCKVQTGIFKNNNLLDSYYKSNILIINDDMCLVTKLEMLNKDNSLNTYELSQIKMNEILKNFGPIDYQYSIFKLFFYPAVIIVYLWVLFMGIRVLYFTKIKDRGIENGK